MSNIREARLMDLGFLLEAVIAAERSGTDASVYERVLRLSVEEQQEMLAHIFAAELPYCELYLPNFLIEEAEDGTPRGCICGWMEREGEDSSGLIKSKLMAQFLGMERWMAARPNMEQLIELDIPRHVGSVQLDCIYVDPAHRGKRIATRLLDAALNEFGKRYPLAKAAQSFSVLENESARKAFVHAGFKVMKRTRSDNPAIAELFPGTGRILWEKPLQASN